MARQILDTTAGAGDTGKAGGDKLNANIAELFGMAGIATPKTSVSLMGHSFAALYMPQIVSLSAYRVSHANLDFDFRQVFDPAGGGATTTVVNNSSRNFAVGGSTSAHMVATQLPEFLKRPSTALYIWAGHNDDWGTSPATTIPGSVANVKTVIDAALATGVTRIIRVMGEAKQGSSTGLAGAVNAYNALLKKLVFSYAAAGANVKLLSTGFILSDHQQTGTNALIQASLTCDGTHPSVKGEYLLTTLVGNDQKTWANERYPRMGLNAGDYDPTTFGGVGRRGNIFGPVGNMMGTSGLTSASTFPGTIAGTGASSRLIVPNTGITTSIDTGAYGQRRQVIAPTAAGTIDIQIQNAGITGINQGDATRLYETEYLLDLTAATGFMETWLRAAGSVNYETSHTGSPVNDARDVWPGAITDNLFVYSMFPHPAPADNPLQDIFLTFGPGFGGSVAISGMFQAEVS